MNDTTTYNSSIGHLIEPESIVYSFNTPGWYLLLALLVLIAFIVAFIQYRKYKKNAYRRKAVQQIENLLKQKDGNVVFGINKCLKKMAVQLFGRKKVAALYGLEWFQFLNSTMQAKETFDENSFKEFTKALYNCNYKLNDSMLGELNRFAILWILNHRSNV